MVDAQAETIDKIFAASSMYEVLDVSPNASAAEIRKKYLKRSVMVHPDRCSDPRATAAFQRVSEAYDTLYSQSNTQERQTAGSTGPSQSPAPPDFTFDDALRVFKTAVRAAQMARGATEIENTGSIDDILRLASAMIALREAGAFGTDARTVASVAGGIVAGASVAAALLPQSWRQSIREHVTPDNALWAISAASLVAGVVVRALNNEEENNHNNNNRRRR
uniref:J domain-containing protein n=1 Tax=Aureoumbra lagunensis TaxID=44058 RepID=A0A7S3K6Y9_9STRA|mmetsp:Transcript_6094/g.9046  ORF Transcript_6094/g.9046 Transcript_6094/m.9046 type:complete len:221 (+) Transcript_6094:228-890(+)|eukprot:CAMPEP_0197318028 /NCGR_PEP_ID=MMETSP0891-20130614/49251_1 /TAXON_ID=44058 ORGANISM="Aureoumbra lagunensis, Strain CCMP1510" /NCGR_SAMPLE_ID=MMETSP0891 /ASSEMBLY_ACC=CAM_ASM_000534 /LENGTH=220 /DNA_ID=CAMNT_0042808277 /DNA_START=134 /DNA_END=796 /DNA_ORIENTATION=-